MLLLLMGASRTGRSTLARSLGKALRFGDAPHPQTVQSAEAPDPRRYRPETRPYIVLDNVNDIRKFILAQKALFQANNDEHTLGERKTGCYHVWLWKVPLVLKVDMSAK